MQNQPWIERHYFMTETLFDFYLSSTYYVEFEHHTWVISEYHVKSQYKLPNFSKVWSSGQKWSSKYLILWLRGLFSYVLSYLLPYLWVYCWDLLALSFSFDFYPIPRNICLEFLNIWSDENLFLIFWHLFHERKGNSVLIKTFKVIRPTQ